MTQENISLQEKIELLFSKALNAIPNGSDDCTDCVDVFYKGIEEIFKKDNYDTALKDIVENIQRSHLRSMKILSESLKKFNALSHTEDFSKELTDNTINTIQNILAEFARLEGYITERTSNLLG